MHTISIDRINLIPWLLELAQRAKVEPITISSHEAETILLPAVIEIRALREETRRLTPTKLGD